MGTDVPLIQELRRRNVIRMAGLYLVGAWRVVLAEPDAPLPPKAVP